MSESAVRIWCQVCGYVTQAYIEEQCPRLEECHMLPDQQPPPSTEFETEED